MAALMLLPVARGASPDDKLGGPARELAAKIAASLGAGEPLALTVRNISSLPESGVAGVRSALEEELRRRGVRLEAGAGICTTCRPMPMVQSGRRN